MQHEDRRRHDCRPEVEPLDSLTLLSIISPAPSSHPSGSAEVATSMRIRTTRPVALNFTVQGSYQVIETNPDVGRTHQFQAESKGRTRGLGATTVDGAITTPGFVAQGYATGRLLAHTSRGDLQIQLAGPLTAGFSAFPGQAVLLDHGRYGEICPRTRFRSRRSRAETRREPIDCRERHRVGPCDPDLPCLPGPPRLIEPSR